MRSMTTDIRDLRDPQKLGDLIDYLARAHKNHPISYSEAYDNYDMSVADVTHDDSMGKQCVREYRTELESRAADGDRYATSALQSINAGKGVIGYDDAGP